jgi:hypothetical protein
MLNDISDPAICGAKEPKIAMLMWVLHNSSANNEKSTSEETEKKAEGLLSTIRGWFAK